MTGSPRLLFVTPCASNHVSGGGTAFTNLFRGWPSDRIATLFAGELPTRILVTGGEPDPGYAAAMLEIAGEQALSFDPSDPSDRCQTVLARLEDASLRCSLGAEAAARTRDFTWEKTAARTAEVLRRCAA